MSKFVVYKGGFVVYSTGSAEVRAIVRTVHRDGTFTVVAQFYQRNDEDVPGYLGFKTRIGQKDLVKVLKD